MPTSHRWGGPVKPGLWPATSMDGCEIVLPVRESAPTVTLTIPRPPSLHDAHAIEAPLARPSGRLVREAGTAVATKPGRLRIALIKAGWSLNNVYYSREVLAHAAVTKAWPAGSFCYADHAPDAEEEAYPSGTIKNLAAVLTTDAVWNDAAGQLEAEVRLFAPWREAITDMAEHIGMSIRAWVYAEHGEAEGRQGLVVSSIESGRSVDFVTVPAAGGAVLSVLESVRQRTAEGRTVGGWLESRLHLALTTFADDMYGDGRLTREERITLSSAIGKGLQAYVAEIEASAPQLYERDPWSYPEPAATSAEEARRTAEATAEETRAALCDVLRDTYGGERVYVWVRDWDPDRALVWFDQSDADGECSTWQQAYTTGDDGAVTLDGERTQAMARTVYDPVPTDEPDDGMAEAAATQPPDVQAVAEDVTDGAPPTVTDPPTEEETGMSGTQTGAPPAQAGTAPVVDTPPAAPVAEAANTAVLEAMRALTRQVTALTEANTTLARRADERDAADRVARNRQTAREAVAAALNAPEVPADLRAQIAPRVTVAVLANIPVTESGDVDADALGQRVTEAIAAESGYAAQLLESAGVGRPAGLGSAPAKEQTVEEFEASLTKGFEALGLNPAAAKIAAQGRS